MSAEQLLCSIGKTLQVLHLPISLTDPQQEFAMHHVLCLGEPQLAAAPCEGCKWCSSAPGVLLVSGYSHSPESHWTGSSPNSVPWQPAGQKNK